MQRLVKALTAISNCPSHPQFTINFKIKDPAPLELTLLKSAGENARAKATILCEAAGGKLGKLLKINYTWNKINTYSYTSCDLDDILGIEDSIGVADCDASMPLFPEDIEKSDSADFIWEIE